MKPFILLPFFAFLVFSCSHAATGSPRPNVIFILADDMGYDSVQANNPKSGIPTPAIDRLIDEGMNFTDAHADTSVCTPTRYGLLTGRYSWRSGLKSGVTWSWFPSIIQPEITTVAELFQQSGYDTACIGKWHLGIDFMNKQGQTIAEEIGFQEKDLIHCANAAASSLKYDWRNIDFSQPVKGGPTDHGFDYYFGDDLPNMPPYVFFKNDRMLGIPTVEKPKTMFGSPGPMIPGWKLEAVMPAITADARKYIQLKAKSDKPFFLYFSLTAPHTPIAPSKAFQGRSGLSLYADWIMETDWAVGEILAALDEQGIANNTLVIFTADNGTTGAGELKNLKEKGTDLAVHFRGLKRSLYEGGHRMPYVVRWPGHTPAGSSCDETICLNDFMATAAEITGFELKDDMAVDSHSLLKLYEGGQRTGHPPVIHHDFDGGYAIRNGDWKLIFKLDRKTMTFSRELFNLKDDIRETTDLIEKYPMIVSELSQLFESLVKNGRSTTGPAQKNFEHPEWKLPF